MISDPGLAGEIGERFDHVLVDEYQDTNRLQASILFALKPGGRGLTVVGDDAQSIYSFRAATVRNILDFPGQFSPPAVIITLDRNYRSTQPILAAANGVIDLACERFTKNLWTDRIAAERPQLVSVGDETGQVEYIVARVLENREGGTTLKQQATGRPDPLVSWCGKHVSHRYFHVRNRMRGAPADHRKGLAHLRGCRDPRAHGDAKSEIRRFPADHAKPDGSVALFNARRIRAA